MKESSDELRAGFFWFGVLLCVAGLFQDWPTAVSTGVVLVVLVLMTIRAAWVLLVLSLSASLLIASVVLATQMRIVEALLASVSALFFYGLAKYLSRD